MSPYNRFTQAYMEESLTNFYPLNAFKNAILNYIQIRESWSNGTSGGKKFGWRGAFASGRLFFNRQKTSNNLRVMREIVEIIESQLPYVQKISRIKNLRGILSSGGMGQELVDVFLATAVDEKTAYISREMHEGLEESLLVGEGKKYQGTRVLGRGVYGEITSFQHQQSGDKVVVKKIHNKGATREQIVRENELFQEVYEHLGRPYFGTPGRGGVVLSGKHASISKIIMPELPGSNMIRFARGKPNYDEDMLFTSTFNFLWAMHDKLKIAHRDCHYENVMVLDDLYNVFIIDFGWGVKLIEDGENMGEKIAYFRDSMILDLGFIIASIIVLRYITRRPCSDLKLSDVAQRYGLERWLGYAFTSMSEFFTKVPEHISKNIGSIRCRIRP